MSKIREILEPIVAEYQAESAINIEEAYSQGVDRGRAYGAQTSFESLENLDANLDTLRTVAQTLIDDCETILNRRDGAQQTNGNIWTGMPINAARDIKQRAIMMLRLLDGEEL